MGISIKTLTQTLETIAPLQGAAEWDNVGLLLRGTRDIRSVGLCIDLTPPVWEELSDSDAIIAYHPPIFRGLKRLDGATPRQQTLLAAIRRGIHLYAPHTALDAAVDGMSAWLAAAIAPSSTLRELRPIQPSAFDPAVGMGRRAQLAQPVTLRDSLPRIKRWLGLEHVRIAGDLDRPRTSVAVCPGSGGSVLRGLHDVDVLITGELGHHEVLAHVSGGGAVVLTDHTNCERGFLPHYAEMLRSRLPEITIQHAVMDRDPLAVF